MRPPSDYRPRLIVGGIIIALAVGLRFEVGGDWNTYLYTFEWLQSTSLWTAMGRTDPAYGFINWIAGNAGLGIWAVNLICAVIFTVGLLSLCRGQPNPNLAMATAIPYLVIVVAMGYTRQSAALGFIMLALSYYFRGATVRMMVALTLAAAFHKSAVIVIPMIAVASSRQRMTTFLALMLLAVTTYYAFLAGATDKLYEVYIKSRYASSGAGIRLAMNLVPSLLLIALWRRFGFQRQELRLWMIFAFASLAALAAFAAVPSSTAIDRVALYLIPLQVVVLSRLPYVFGSGGRASMPFLIAVLIYSVAVELVWLTYGRFSFAWLPYRTYLLEPDAMTPNSGRER